MRTLRIALAIALGLSFRPLLAEGELVKWRSIAQSETESKRTGKPILYFMTADWCGPCRTMKTEVFSDPQVVATIEKTFVPVEVVDRSREEGHNLPEVRALMGRFRIRGFPTLSVSRPGSTQAFQATGWAGKRETLRYLAVARSKFEELEKARAEGKR